MDRADMDKVRVDFARAARILGISQPALSQKIQRVETEIGMTLFDRGQRHVSLTPAGRALVADLPELLTRIDTVLARAGRIARGDEGFLRVGFIENASFHLVPHVITRLRRRFPNAQVELVEMISPDIPDALARGDIDVALTRPLPTDTLRAHEVMRERYYVALSDGDPLVRQETVPVRALCEMTFIAAAGRKSSYLRGQFAALFERHGFRLGIGQEVNQLPAIIALVAAGGGSRLLFENGMFQVGPSSSGAWPGPACYRNGGPPSLTDANLVLGRLVPEHFPSVFGENEDQPLSASAAKKTFAGLHKNNSFLFLKTKTTCRLSR